MFSSRQDGRESVISLRCELRGGEKTVRHLADLVGTGHRRARVIIAIVEV